MNDAALRTVIAQLNELNMYVRDIFNVEAYKSGLISAKEFYDRTGVKSVLKEENIETADLIARLEDELYEDKTD